MNVRRAFAILLLLLTGVAQAALTGSAGHYAITLATDPAVVPVGTAELVVAVSLEGKPLEGATVTTFTRMPGMQMGERPEMARPVAGQPGVYRARASFPMGGAYQVKVTVAGPHGTAETTFSVATGQDMGRGGLPAWLLPAVVILVMVLVVAWRMRATGQRLDTRKVVNRQVLGGLFLVAVMLVGAFLAVRHFRRPGSMTPLEAQVMEMDMPAPIGVTPVILARVERRTLEEVVRYTGQALAFDEQVVSARTTGVIEWMPFYLGDRVTRGQVLARLDTTVLEPRLAASRAAERMAASARTVAEGEHRQQQADLERAQAQSRAARAAAEAAAARIWDAEAEVQAATAGQAYSSQFLGRSRELAREGAISQEELQRDQVEAADSEARLRTARARLAEARAGLRQAEEEAVASKAEVDAALAAYRTGSRRIDEADAGREAARSQSAVAAAERNQADLVANLDGVVSERAVSPGTLVQPGQVLLQIAQVDPIRLQANVAEPDLLKVRVGDRVRVGEPGGQVLESRVSAVRQGLVEALVPNQGNRFLPGSFVAMDLVTRRLEGALVVPSTALVTAAAPAEGVVASEAHTYAWVARGSAEALTAKRVRVTPGPSDGQRTAVTSGLAEGDLVVASGHQYLKEGDPVADPSLQARTKAAQSEVQTSTIKVSSQGFTPASLELKAGVPARLTFLRVDEQNCGTEVVFPALGIRKALPLNRAVVVEFTPRSAQTLDYSCGMDMLRGQVVVR